MLLPISVPTSVVQPAGSKWPHVAGPWSDAERDAAFRMRHQHGMTDAVLVEVVGVTRQAINEQIGATKAPSTGRWPNSLTWRPSGVLLSECGLSDSKANALQNWFPRAAAAAR